MTRKIPKIAHCFWFHPNGLPYLRFLSIASYALMNPDHKLILYSPTSALATGNVFNSHEQGCQLITRDYTSHLLEIPNVSIEKIDPKKRSFPSTQAKSAVHFTDLLRLELLSTVGGYWIDSDIIFTSPIDQSIYSSPEFSNSDVIHTISNLGPICPYISHRISFMGSSPNSEFFRSLYSSALADSNNGDYEVFGAGLYQKIYPNLQEIYLKNRNTTFTILPTSAIYGIDLSAFSSKRSLVDEIICSSSILGVHWYGGGDHLKETYEKVGNIDLNKTTLASAISHPNLLEKLFIFSEEIAFPYIR